VEDWTDEWLDGVAKLEFAGATKMNGTANCTDNADEFDSYPRYPRNPWLLVRIADCELRNAD